MATLDLAIPQYAKVQYSLPEYSIPEYAEETPPVPSENPNGIGNIPFTYTQTLKTTLNAMRK